MDPCNLFAYILQGHSTATELSHIYQINMPIWFLYTSKSVYAMPLKKLKKIPLIDYKQLAVEYVRVSPFLKSELYYGMPWFGWQWYIWHHRLPTREL